MTYLSRRGLLLSSALCPIGLACTSMVPAAAVSPVGLKSNAKVHSYQAASFSYSFMMGHAFYWPKLLDPLTTDGYALLDALHEKGLGVAMEIVFDDPEDSASIQVNYAFPKKGQPEPAHPFPPVAVVEGVDEVVLHKGRIALYSVVAMMSQLNVSNDTLQGHAFALLVLKEKIKKGEKADWFDANRPAEESLSDIDLALQLIADHYQQIQSWRSRVLTIVALIRASEMPGGMEALKAEVDHERKVSDEWLAKHRPPTQEDFGVAMAELPTPESLVKKLDIDLGIVAAVLQTAQGIATGSPQATLEGLSKLAPKDSTVGVTLKGLAAASKGDVGGVIDAVAKLTDNEAELAAVKQRLAPFQALAKKTGIL